jgi:hypothetical protein
MAKRWQILTGLWQSGWSDYTVPMSSNNRTKPLNKTERRSTIEEFTDYCSAERESRNNSGNEFDTDRFDRAVRIALQQLDHLQKEGWT